MPRMAKRKKQSEDQQNAGPSRSPHRAAYVRLDLDVDAALEQFIASLEVRPTFKEAVQTLLREALTARGHYPPS